MAFASAARRVLYSDAVMWSTCAGTAGVHPRSVKANPNQNFMLAQPLTPNL
jgi:hypothetical protein